VVASATPPPSTVVVARKPVPLTVSVIGPDPAITLVGLIELTVGAVCVVPPELEEDPPQPARIADTKRQEDAEKRMKGFMTK
jgi:hypothetical protein